MANSSYKAGHVLCTLKSNELKISAPLKHQSAPEISGALCNQLFTLSLPSWETLSDHLTTAIHILSFFKLMVTSPTGLADLRLAWPSSSFTFETPRLLLRCNLQYHKSLT